MGCPLQIPDFDSASWMEHNPSAGVEVVVVVGTVVAETAVVAVGIDLGNQSFEVAILQSQVAESLPDRVLQSVEGTGTQAADLTTAGSSREGERNNDEPRFKR